MRAELGLAACALLMASAVAAGAIGTGQAGPAGLPTGDAADGAPLTGVVQWANGTAAADATVLAAAPDANVSVANASVAELLELADDPPAGVAVAVTNATGRYALSPTAGEYTVVAVAGVTAGEPRTVTVPTTANLTVGDRSPPADAVQATVRRTIESAGPDSPVTFRLSAEEERAVSVRQIQLRFADPVEAGWFELASVDPDGATVSVPEGVTSLLYAAASPDGTVANATLLVRLPRPLVDGGGDLSAYGYRDGEWVAVSATRYAVTDQVVLLSVETDSLGYLAVTAEEPTTREDVDPWTPTGTTSVDERPAGVDVRTGAAVLALLAAVVLALRGHRGD